MTKFLWLSMTCLFPLLAPAEIVGMPTLPYKWRGDLRVRQQHEKIGDDDARTQMRLRARLGLQVQVQDDLQTVVSFSTSRSNRSNNQKLGDGAEPGSTRRFFGLHLAYLDWQAAPDLKIEAGRFPQMHFAPGGSQVLLDDDLALEGAAASFERPIRPAWSFGTNLGTSLIREEYDSARQVDQNDAALHWLQSYLRWQPDAKGTTVTFGAGVFQFAGFQGQRFSGLTASGTPQGNSFVIDGADLLIKNKYKPVQAFVELRQPFGSYDSTFFYERIINSETSDPNRADAIGVAFGQGDWDLELVVEKIESDAVSSLFMHSDFCEGMTDCQGFEVAYRYRLNPRFSVKTSLFNHLLEISTAKTDYQKINLDFTGSF